MARPKLEGIQALRAIACIAVFIQHLTFHVSIAKGVDFVPLLKMDFGQFGVRVFFVISGFVMAACVNQGSSFLLKRATRIYPPYWLAICLSAALLINFIPNWHIDISSAILRPTSHGNNSLYIPYWTLLYEITFYVILYFLILARATERKVALFCVVWLVVIYLVNLYKPVENAFMPGAQIFFSPINVFFIFGLLLGFEMRRPYFLKFPIRMLSLVSVATWALSTAPALAGTAQMLILQAFSYACLTAAIARAPVPQFLVKIGNMSYGVYLVHVVFMIFTINILKIIKPELRFISTWATVGIVSALGSLAFGWIEYQLHERYLKSFGLQKRAALPARP